MNRSESDRDGRGPSSAADGATSEAESDDGTSASGADGPRSNGAVSSAGDSLDTDAERRQTADADRTAGDRPTMSVVVVARNEADRIGDCIESVFEVCPPVADTEVVVVDSNSTDDTVAIAREYPVTVASIPDDELCSCGAGRHVGRQYVDGEYVLFVDGDMMLADDWIETALSVVERNEDVAGVDGWLTDRRGGSGEVRYLRGVALYSAAAVDDVGGFDPRIHGLGDVDTGNRLRAAGYRLIRLPVVVATHPSSSGVGERIRRWNEGYYASNGQVLRKSLGEPRVFAAWLYRFRFHLSYAAWLALGAGLAAVAPPAAFLAWVAASAAGVTGLVALKGLRWTALKLTLRFGMFVAGLAIGLWQGPQPPEYPIERTEVVARPEANEDATARPGTDD